MWNSRPLTWLFKVFMRSPLALHMAWPYFFYRYLGFNPAANLLAQVGFPILVCCESPKEYRPFLQSLG
eukprot:c45715_g1_i1 orf=74-277(+)